MGDTLDYFAIGSRVRVLRMQYRLTQERLAEQVGISPSFIGHIERGEKKASLETMSCIAKQLHTTIDYLVLGKKNRCDQQNCQLYEAMKEVIYSYSNDVSDLSI